ncbi:MAG: hypothetical protein QOJ25_919, partial [Solirubrobacteraceae bacterium]|nr:hypothetical protein [Solirubrobacteraceae bacterium]
MSRRLAALVPIAVLAWVIAPAAAVAALTTPNPLNPTLPPISAPTPTVSTPSIVPTNTTASPGGGFSSTDAIAVAAGAAALLIGISFFIWRDARKRAPRRGRPAAVAPRAAGRPHAQPQPQTRKPRPAAR